jgi:hypothetical protein
MGYEIDALGELKWTGHREPKTEKGLENADNAEKADFRR